MKELQAGSQGSVTVRKTAGSLHLGSGYTSNEGALTMSCETHLQPLGRGMLWSKVYGLVL